MTENKKKFIEILKDDSYGIFLRPQMLSQRLIFYANIFWEKASILEIQLATNKLILKLQTAYQTSIPENIEEILERKGEDSMGTRKKIVEKIAEKCWLELEYDDVVNERTEEIDYELIVDCVLRCWREVFRECIGQ